DWQRAMLTWLTFTMRWPAFMEEAIERVAEEAIERVAQSDQPSQRLPELLSGLIPEHPPEEDRPARLDLELLDFSRDQFNAFSKLAGNFLIEHPRREPDAD